MADIVKQMLAKPIQYADEVTKIADQASSFRAECLEIKSKTERLSSLLRQAARSSGDLYERPTRRIIDDTSQVLDKALTLTLKCTSRGLRRLLTIIPAAALRKTAQQLENSIGDLSWLLRVSATSASSSDDNDTYLGGLPPIAANEPILCLIWEQIAILCSGNLEDRADAAASLVSLARDNDRYGSLIIDEGGVPPLLKLAKEGRGEGQENAARAIGLLGRDTESVEQIVNAGACQVFAKILKEGNMRVQVMVAWAVSELAAHHRKCQDPFAQNNIIRLLVKHLAFETIPEHSRYTIPTKQSIHSIVMANKPAESGQGQGQGQHATSQMQSVVANTMAMKPSSNNSNHNQNQNQNQNHNTNHKPRHDALTVSSIKKQQRELEDPATKAEMKSMAARALRYLCAGNVNICRSVTESRALLCLAVLLEKGHEDVRYNSALALMEITAVAEQDSSLRRSAFKPTAPVAKAVVEQFLGIIEKPDSELMVPSIRSIGNLARTFRATETRFIRPLVKLLDETEPEVMCEAALALNKFAGPDNFLHETHCKEIIKEGGIKHLQPQVYFGEVGLVQLPCFVLLCYLAMHVPDSEELANEDVIHILEWAAKQQVFIQDKEMETLVNEAKNRLELYQSRGSKGYH